jgi:hypothetical protein
MNVTPEVCVGAWKRLRTIGKPQLLSIRRHLARRRLEANLASLIDAARGHAAQKLSPGAPEYVILQRHSESLVRAYCEQWQTSPDQLHAELPALHKLPQLAHRSPQQQLPIMNAVLIVLAVILGSFILGLAGAFVRLGYHLIGGNR